MAVLILEREERSGVVHADIYLVRTDDFRRAMYITDDDDVPIDITGASLECHIREEPGQTGTPLLTIDNQGATGNGSRITISPGSGGGEDGDFETFFDDEDIADCYDSQNAPVDTTVILFYDIVLTLEQADATVILQGRLLIAPGVTRF